MRTALPLPAPRDAHLRRMANALRALAMDAVEKAKSGHPGIPMGMAAIATLLFTQFLRFDPRAPQSPDRDRFVLTNGHGSSRRSGLPKRRARSYRSATALRKDQP
jgi:transketolase